MKLVLGLDIGITSVGWGIVNIENGEIIDSGVRLFAEGNSGLNATRRELRCSRRLIRRRQHRIYRVRELLLKNEIISEDFEPLDDPYEIRFKGLNNKLTNEELATAILHISKRRGITGIISVDDSTSEEGLSTKRILSENNKLLSNKYICEVQLERLKEGKIRGENNRFDCEDYIKELKKIFSNQELSMNLQEKIINIIKSKREYYDGPGSEESPTPYGQFYLENGKLIHVDMIEKMRGHCTIYPDELRAPKMSYTADLFNFLNDLNNITINGEHISREEKEEIITQYINKKGNITIKQLEKFLGVSSDEMEGFRISDIESKTKLLTEFKGYKILIKSIKDNGLDMNLLEDKDIVDNIIEILTNKKGYKERYESLLNIKLSNKEADAFSKITGISGYHSLSLKVMKEVIPDLLNTEYNQMQIFQMNGYFNQKTEKYNSKKIPFDNDAILSSVAKRSQKETLRIVEAVTKKYGDLDSIVVEMPRDKNSDEEKKRISREQANGKKINDEIKELVGDKKLNYELRLKLRLYKEQNGKCLYTGKAINIDDLISNPYMYDIDHIIPISISFDDSMHNKVLVTHKSNADKGQRTPYQYFKLGISQITYEEFKNNVLSLSISNKKKYYLLYEKDINKYENKKEFINRNLVDTQYASRVLLNTLTNYFKANNIDTKVYVIRGSITNMFRKKAQINKDRDEDYKHHAVDALIIAGVKKMKLYDNVLDISLTGNNTYDNKTGEIITLENEKDFFNQDFLKYVNSLRNLKTKYSHKIDTKPNRGMTDQTIYSTRKIDNEDYIIAKYKNIYDKDGELLAKRINDGKGDTLLMYKNDPESYNILVKIVKSYPQEKNPFEAFKKETNDFIRKKSKNGHGPAILSVKYISKKLGSHVDISKANITNGKKEVLLQINPYRLDFYRELTGEYKFLRICYKDIRLKSGKYTIDKNWYSEEMKNRNISESAIFQFSLYKNDIFYYEKQEMGSVKKKMVRYNGTNYNQNKVEYKNIHNKMTEGGNKRDYITIGSKIIKLEKRATDILGNIYKVENEYCKFEI